MARDEAENAQNSAKLAKERSELAFNTSKRNVDDLTDLLKRMSDFINMDHAEPENIKMIANEVGTIFLGKSLTSLIPRAVCSVSTTFVQYMNVEN